jgi:hypothetical protein
MRNLLPNAVEATMSRFWHVAVCLAVRYDELEMSVL